MLIDFNDIREYLIDCQNCGEGTMSVKMFAYNDLRIIPTKIHEGGSIGPHVQDTGDDINYILAGNGVAICDGEEEPLSPGVCHLCPKGSEHTIKNTGMGDLVMLTVVVNK